MTVKTITKILAPVALALATFGVQANDLFANNGETYGEPRVSHVEGFQAPAQMQFGRLSANTGGETYPEINGDYEPAESVRIQTAVLGDRQFERLYIN